MVRATIKGLFGNYRERLQLAKSEFVKLLRNLRPPAALAGKTSGGDCANCEIVKVLTANVLRRGEAREKSSFLWEFDISRVLRPDCDQTWLSIITTLVGNSRAKHPEKAPSGWHQPLLGCFAPTRTCFYELFHTLYASVTAPYTRLSCPNR